MNLHVFELILAKNLDVTVYYNISENQIFWSDSFRYIAIFQKPKLSAIGTKWPIVDRGCAKGVQSDIKFKKYLEVVLSSHYYPTSQNIAEKYQFITPLLIFANYAISINDFGHFYEYKLLDELGITNIQTYWSYG